MASVQIRNVPDEVRLILRARAAAAGVSLSEFLLREMTRIAARPPIAEVLRGAAERTDGVSRDAALSALRAVRDRSDR
jgi:plasmid stability protein